MIGGGIIVTKTKYILPILVLSIIVIALIKRVNAYQSFQEGVKDGLSMFTSIYPALLAMMFAITLLQQSNLMNLCSSFFESIIPYVPKEVWPMIIFRPISGSASLAVLIDLFQKVGVDSYQAIMASIIQGSTDTTIYVITLYFSSVGIRKIKNSLAIGLMADIAGISMAVLLTILFFS